MKMVGKKSVSSVIKIFLIVLFVLCIISIITVPMFARNNGKEFLKDILLEQPLGITIIFIYLSGIPALVMLYQFIKIFISLEKEQVFIKKIEKSFLVASICSIIIGIIYAISTFVGISKIINFEYSSIVVYIFFSAITSIIFFIFGIGLIVLREVYKTAIENKEENDLTI